MSDRYHLGLDVGSISLNTVLLDDNQNLVFEDYARTHGRPYDTALRVLGELLDKYDPDQIATVSTTGSGGKTLAGLIDGVFINEIIAQTRATGHFAPQARTIIDMGGEDSTLILAASEDGGRLTIADFAMNSMCAAGTGSFLDQQASRLGYTIEEFGQEALRSTTPPRLAGRCSVFAKTDMIHLQQGATPDFEIIAGLCYALIRNLRSNLAKGKRMLPPVSFQGGVAANEGVRRALVEVMDLGEGELIIPEHFYSMGAIGAALSTMDRLAENPKVARGWGGLERLHQYVAYERPEPSRLSPLVKADSTPKTEYRSLDDLPKGKKIDVYLGVDVGSISTNVVLIDEDQNVIDREYLMTAGRPLEAIKMGLKAVGDRVGDKVHVVGACTTGSGRYLTGDFIGADVVRNEITAQATAAAAIDPEVDTIFEIGGQDSKFISLEGGAIVDFMMNKACAAGTGSFLEEQAEKLNISIKGEFGSLALSAKNPVQLGERCTVFMESDLVHHQQQGAETPDLVAGLSYSIVTNYLNKVVENRRVGDRIFYQGATAFNQGIVAAFEAVTGKKITVPDHADVTGAIGSAILAMRERTWDESRFKGFDLSERQYTIDSFECNGCANACEIRKVTIEGETPLFYGSRCEKYDIKKKQAAESGIPDLFEERTEMLFNPPEAVPDKPPTRGVLGVPRVMIMHELMPFFKTFLTSLGFEVVLSEKSNKRLIHKGVEAVVNEPCFPTKVSYGHILDLMSKGVKRIFVPSVINMEKKGQDAEYSKICPYSQTLPYTSPAAIDFEAEGVELITGPVYFAEGERVLTDNMVDIARKLGVGANEAKKALSRAREAQENFFQKLQKRGQEVLELLEEKDWLGMVVVTRPYNGMDPGLNLNLSSKLRDLGVVGIPMDFLPLHDPQYHEEANYQYWRYGQKMLAAAEIIRRNPRLYGIYITNFGCGPDSFILHFFGDTMRGKPFLEIEIDEHSSDVGAVTRLEAFLDSLKNVTVPEESQSLLTFRGRDVAQMKDRKIFIPNMTDQAHAIEAAFAAVGIEAEVMPASDAESLALGRRFTSGKECYPCILTTGDMMRIVQRPDFDPDRMAFMMAASNGPCRFGQYHRFQRLALDEQGFPQVPIIAPDQGDSFYQELDAMGGKDFRRLAWSAVVAIDLIIKKRLETRCYEVNPGQTDAAYQECLEDILTTTRRRGDMVDCLKRCRARQELVRLKNPGSKPVVGVVGEIYTRNNDFSNENAIRNIERFGGEPWMPTVAEWILYVNQDSMDVSWMQRRWKDHFTKKLVNYFQARQMHQIEEIYHGTLRNFHEPTTVETFNMASPYVHRTFQGETILSMGKSEDFAMKGACGMVNIIPFTCMPGNIVESLLKRFRERHDNMPVLNIACDGQEDTNTLARMEAFMYQVHQYRQRREQKGALKTT